MVVAAAGPRWLRRVLTAAAALYLASTVLYSIWQRVPRSYLPDPMLYFVQTACLFPRAAQISFDYRLEVWDCAAQRFRETDAGILFPMHQHDKESRFHRLAHFHRQNRAVMRPFERHVVTRLNTLHAGRAVGGVRLSSLRSDLPSRGEPVPRWSRPVLAQHPPDEVKRWYYTPVSRRHAFCAGRDPGDNLPSAQRERDDVVPEAAP